jgi:hypothetical protein
MRHCSAVILLVGGLACWAGTPRVSSPAAVEVAVHPVEGHLVSVEGVAGRLSLGRRVWDRPVEAVWPAGARALVRSGAGWQLLEWNQDLTVSRVLELGERNWVSPVWNAAGSAWLACDEVADRCGIYRAENGTQSREIRSTGGLRALSLADDAGQALLSQEDRAVLWDKDDALVPVTAGEGFRAAFAPGGARFAVINSAGTMIVKDTRTASSIEVEAPDGAVGLLWAGGFLMTVHRSGEIRRWDDRGETASIVRCDCAPTGVWAAGQGMVRLHDSLKQVSHYLDFGRGEVAFSILPASVSEVQ